MWKRTRLSLAIGAAFGAGLTGMAPGAWAQAPAPATPQSLERVEITGSLLRRIEGETALPVTVLKTEELARAGVTSAEQAVQYISQNQQSTVTANSVGASNGGASFADLRGLGAARTLVLVNGKRIVNNPYGTVSVDLNALPFVAIDRIEVLTDGASAIYGTDAVAGVINFITRREYQGFNVSAETVLPTNSGEGEVYRATIGGGYGSLATQGWNIFGGYSYRKQEPLKATDRDFARSAVVADRGVFKASPTTFPANYNQGEAVEGNPTVPACSPPFSLFLPNVFGPNSCGFDYVPFINIIPEQEQQSLLLKGSLALGKSATASLEYLWAQNIVDTIISPTPLTGLNMPSTNPFYPGGGITPGTAGIDPAEPVSLGWRTTIAGGRASKFENTTDRILGLVEGEFAKWNYQVSAFQSKSDVSNTFTGGYLNNNGIRAGLAGTGGAPFLNPFGPNTAAGSAYITQNLILGEIQQAEGTLKTIAAGASGDIFQIAGRPVSLAVGAEFSKDEVQYTNDFTLIRQAASSGLAGAEDVTGDRDIKALAAEINFPLLRNLDLNLAVRYDDYSDFGSTTNPKISIRYTPVQQLLLRASYNTGFRAPTLFDVYAPNSLTFTGSAYDDPILCPGGTLAAGGVSTRDCGIQFNQQQGGNRALTPEESKAWTFGFVAQPIPSIAFGLDYWKYQITNSIGVLGEQAIFGDTSKYASLFVRCSQATPAERALIDACGIPGGDPLAYIKNTQLNLGDYRTDGFDGSFQWNGEATPYGRFSAGIRGTYIRTYKYQLEQNGEYFDNLGNYFNGIPVPRLRTVLNLGWQYSVWSAQVLNRYTSGYTDANAEAGVDPEFYNTVGSYSVWDISVSYTGFKGLTLTAGLLNAFDKDPPFSNQSDAFQVGYDQRLTNPIGRAVLLRAAYQF